jgi:hypothetical protein
MARTSRAVLQPKLNIVLGITKDGHCTDFANQTPQGSQ